jgi:pseudouridine-5'-phosphate glycosidase
MLWAVDYGATRLPRKRCDRFATEPTRPGETMTIETSPDVARALAVGRAVVALESTLLCHGIPRPRNRELAAEIEDAVRRAGAVPATIAVLDGRIKVGLDDPELERLTTAADVTKCSSRDLPLVVATGGLGATTVAATVFVAARVGIGIMATGGLGGVHLGGERTLDVSADLEELARSPIVVVCSGVKSILDQGRTLERLETLGVPLVGYRCAELPGFYSAQSGLALHRIDDLAGLCRLCRARESLGLPGGMVIAQPPPEELALPKAVVEGLVDDARAAAQARQIHGPAQTPFMLRRMAEQSQGATVRVNCALVIANARLAGELGAALASGQGAGAVERA